MSQGPRQGDGGVDGAGKAPGYYLQTPTPPQPDVPCSLFLWASHVTRERQSIA